MAASTSSISGSARPPRRRQFPFGLVMLLFGAGLGFYGGVSATKRAMTAPVWVQHLFGIEVAPTAPASPTPVVRTARASSPAEAPSAPAVTGPSADGGSMTSGGAADAQARGHAVSKDMVGTWTTADVMPGEGAAGGTMSTSYVFRADGTGDYNSGGKKLYGFNWKADGEEIVLDINGQGPDPDQPWNARVKWSLNDDKTLLTLIPSAGKDPRSFVYSLGPGVYHKKETAASALIDKSKPAAVK